MGPGSHANAFFYLRLMPCSVDCTEPWPYSYKQLGTFWGSSRHALQNVYNLRTIPIGPKPSRAKITQICPSGLNLNPTSNQFGGICFSNMASPSSCPWNVPITIFRHYSGILQLFYFDRVPTYAFGHETDRRTPN